MDSYNTLSNSCQTCVTMATVYEYINIDVQDGNVGMVQNSALDYIKVYILVRLGGKII